MKFRDRTHWSWQSLWEYVREGACVCMCEKAKGMGDSLGQKDPQP